MRRESEPAEIPRPGHTCRKFHAPRAAQCQQRIGPVKLFRNHVCDKFHQLPIIPLGRRHDALRAQGKGHRAIRQRDRRRESPAIGHTLANRPRDQVTLAQERRRIGSARGRVDRARGAALFDLAAMKQDHPIRDGQRLALVVSDKDKCDADLSLQQLQLTLHFQA
jgi:hypothetical protein